MDVDFRYVAFLAMGAYGVGVVLTYLPGLGLARRHRPGAAMATALAAVVGP